MYSLVTQPIWLTGIILIGVTTTLAMCGPIFIRRYAHLDQLRTNNEVAGFKFATIGVLYAVLLAFAVIIVWEKFDAADADVASEAAAAATIYRLTNGIETEPGTAIRNGLTLYLKTVIAEDWPAMEHGEISPGATLNLNGLYAEILAFHPADPRETAIFGELLHQLDGVTQARLNRFVVSRGIVPAVLWMVLFGGAFLTIGFTFFFGTQNLRAQTLMTGALSLLICSGLLIIIAIDHPFAGTVKVGPEAIVTVLDGFGGVSMH